MISRLYIRNFACQKAVAWYVQSTERKNCLARALYLAKLCFRIEGGIKSIQDKQMLKEFVTIGLALQEMLKGISSSRWN